MTDKQYHKIVDLANAGGGFVPVNENASALLEQSHRGEVLSFIEVTARDIKFHRCFFSLLNFIYDYLPDSFKKKVSKDYFYIFVKHLKGQYKVLFEFKDGTKMVEYDSISFGKMSQKAFEDFIRELLPFIYTEIIGAFYGGDKYDAIIATIEEEYLNFLSKL